MFASLADFIGRIADRRSSAVLFSFGIATVFGAVDAILDRGLISVGSAVELHTAFEASTIALLAGVISFVLLGARRERQRIARAELERVMELNHRLRNSLQIIADAHFAETDEEHRNMMFETVESMRRTLQQLFPGLGLDRRKGRRNRAA